MKKRVLPGCSRSELNNEFKKPGLFGGATLFKGLMDEDA